MTIISVAVLFLFFTIPTYNTWLTGNLLHPENIISHQYDRLDEEARRAYKYGGSYQAYKQLVEFCKVKFKIESPVILLPPSVYMQQKKVPNFAVVEPCIFYYLTGCKAVWYDSPGVEKANVALVPGPNGQLALKKIENRNDLNQLLSVYKPYKLDL